MLLGRVADAMVDLFPSRTELLGALEVGGVPIATAISARCGLPVVNIGKQAKAYGTARQVDGPPVAGRRVTLVEDVITTGGAGADATIALLDLGATVDSVVCAIDRSSEPPARLAELGLEARSALTQADLDAARSAD